MSEELFSMMSAKSVNYGGSGGGGIPTLTAQDIAAALGMGRLSRLSANMALYKACDDVHVLPVLQLEINALVARLYYDFKWKSPFEDQVDTALFFQSMGKLALNEVVGIRHSVCNGTGIKGKDVCSGCAGTGYKALSGRKMAANLGLDESVFRRTWLKRFDEIVRHLYAAYWEAVYHVGDQVRDVA